MDGCLAFVKALVFSTFDAVHALANHVPTLDPALKVTAHATKLDILHAKPDGRGLEVRPHSENELPLADATLARSLHGRMLRA